MGQLAAPKKAKGSAAGQYLGYALQPVRLFYHLLTCDPDAHVGLEHADDISVHSADGSTLVEQCKSALKTNPITDWSVDLWKTFHLWIDNANAGVFHAENTEFQLYVTPIKAGKLVQSLSDVTSDAEIQAIVDQIAKKQSEMPSSHKCAEHIDAFLAVEKELLFEIIRSFKLISTDADPLSPIFAHLDATVSYEVAEAACRYGIGDAMNRIEKSIKAEEEPLISAKDFRTAFKAFINKYDATSVLHSLSDQPEDEVIQNTLSQAPPFVRQLKLIDASIEMTTRAASDLLRSSADRTHWAEKGLVFEDSVEEYNDGLKRRFNNIRDEVGITLETLAASAKGKLIYTRCCADTPIPLQGRVVPQHFMPGSLNDLADRIQIGWHPDYVELMSMEDE